MQAPFDVLFENIKNKGFHNHRDSSHSDILVDQISKDLRASCDKLAADLRQGVVHEWRSVRGPDRRNTDLIIGAAKSDGSPELDQVRVLIENKSVVTAHRNRNARYQDIEREMLATHTRNPLAIVVATLIVGACEKVLNVPDCVKGAAKDRDLDFNSTVRPRLSSGDQSLWREFAKCVSENRQYDPLKTVKMFRGLPVRGAAETYKSALDFMLFIPVQIDNVNPPQPSFLGNIDAIADYKAMVEHVCHVYDVRWPAP